MPGTLYGLTERQRAIRDVVCLRTSLTERLQVLVQIGYERGVEPADVDAVRGWLFHAHRARERFCSG